MKARYPFVSAVAICASALALSGCHKSATGQVVAVVNGDEITLNELNTEIGQANIPEGAAGARVRQQVLQQIIDRRLLAQAAKSDGIDTDPEYLIRRRQLEEALLVQFLGKRVGSSLRVPDEAAINRFMSERPNMFANRQLLTLDQIRFTLPADPSRLRALESAKTMEQVMTVLSGLGVRFERGQQMLDTAQVPPQMMQQLNNLPAGEPFIVPSAPIASVSVITARQPAPLTGPQARPVAVQALRDSQLGDVIRRRMQEARSSAEITYQDGFAPPANANAAGGNRPANGAAGAAAGNRAAPAAAAPAAPAAATK